MSVVISAENCEYRAEGNAGIVIRLIKEGKVLRLKKQDNDSKASQSMKDILQELENEVKVIKYVFKPLLGVPFVHTPLIMFLKAEEIKMLNHAIKNFRPVHRKHRNVLEDDTYVSVLPDFCSLPQSLKHIPTYGPVLSIEIKPKQGFMKEENLPNGISPVSLPICRVCMMKQYKLKRHAISSKSGYCPTDLFSGCYTRMFHALRMLCKTPQNNFRIFKDQNLIYSEEKKDDLNELLSDFFVYSEELSYKDLLCDLVIQALTKPFPCEVYKSQAVLQKKFPQKCINANSLCTEKDPCHVLPPCCILERLLNCQLLDNLATSDLYQLYLKVNQNKNKSSAPVGCYSRHEIPPCLGAPGRASNETEYQYASRKVWEFLMALTVKDCSVMIALRHITNSSYAIDTQNVIFDKLGNMYLFSIALVDLDVKLISKAEKGLE